MESKSSNFNLSQFHDINDCNSKITIKTSKQWVLPPRPRPGRKSVNSSKISSNSSISSTIAINSTSPTFITPNSQQIQSVKKELKKNSKKKSLNEKSTTKQSRTFATTTSDIKSQVQVFNGNPIKLALETIKDENKSLKLELSKLVSDLKMLQQKQSETLTHKKRNHLEMEREDSLTSDDDLHHLFINQDSEDEISSTISTPSLINSLNISDSISSLSSIKENQILKIDDFLTTSYFDQSNFISKPNSILKDKNIVKNENMMLIPPSIPIETSSNTKEDFEFTFLKQEQVPNNTHYDSLFNSIFINENDDVFL